ncbi:MAG TPA: ACP phosphodiesterase [Cytophagaceae bacterium]|jgi:acyl carrier protein phosphodiesterase|nr:ACP phosphodiesterase [Cytophagaceae bacterium]
MNYLTKLYLAGNQKLAIGCFIATDLSDRKLKCDIEIFKEGIVFCRELDQFMSSHPVFIKSRRRINPLLDKYYSGELIKIYYDHFLALHWSKFSDHSLKEFAYGTYMIFSDHFHLLPYKTKKTFEIIARKDTLDKYSSIHGFHEAIKFAGSKNGNHYAAESIKYLINSYAQLSGDFEEIFPDLIKYAEKLKNGKRIELRVA